MKTKQNAIKTLKTKLIFLKMLLQKQPNNNKKTEYFHDWRVKYKKKNLKYPSFCSIRSRAIAISIELFLMFFFWSWWKQSSHLKCGESQRLCNFHALIYIKKMIYFDFLAKKKIQIPKGYHIDLLKWRHKKNKQTNCKDKLRLIWRRKKFIV